MDIACESQQIFGLQHFNGFFTHGGSGLFQVQLLRAGDHEDVVLPAFRRDGHQSLEHTCRVLMKIFGDLHAAQCFLRGICVFRIGDFFRVKQTADIGFFSCFRHALNIAQAE